MSEGEPSKIEELLRRILTVKISGRPLGVIVLLADYLIASLFFWITMVIRLTYGYLSPVILENPIYRFFFFYVFSLFGIYKLITDLLLLTGQTSIIYQFVYYLIWGAALTILAIFTYRGRAFRVSMFLLIGNLLMAVTTFFGKAFGTRDFWIGVIGAGFNQLMIYWLSRSPVEGFFKAKKDKTAGGLSES